MAACRWTSNGRVRAVLVSLAFRARHLFVRMKCSFIKTGNPEPSQVIPRNSYKHTDQLEPTSPLWIRIGANSGNNRPLQPALVCFAACMPQRRRHFASQQRHTPCHGAFATCPSTLPPSTNCNRFCPLPPTSVRYFWAQEQQLRPGASQRRPLPGNAHPAPLSRSSSTSLSCPL